LFALGSGAGSVWITREAIAEFERSFTRKITSVLEDERWESCWNAEKCHPLEYVRAIGRHASQRVIQRGRVHIDAPDIAAAIAAVRGQVPVSGRWCQL